MDLGDNMEVNLDSVIRKNYDKIKSGEYRWSDDEVSAVYKLAKSAIKQINLNGIDDTYEDKVQDLVLLFFTKIIPNYDISKNITISTYSYRAFKNYYLNILMKPSIESISLQEKINDQTELGDLFRKNEVDERLRLVKLEIVERFKLLNQKNEEILEYFFSKNKVTTRDLAKKYNVTASCISIRIRKSIELAKKDPVIKKLISYK